MLTGQKKLDAQFDIMAKHWAKSYMENYTSQSTGFWNLKNHIAANSFTHYTSDEEFNNMIEVVKYHITISRSK